MQELTVHELAVLTGYQREHIRLALGKVVYRIEGKKHLFPSVQALQAIYMGDSSLTGQLDEKQERARLAHHNANLAHLKEQQTRGELVDKALVVEMLRGMVISARVALRYSFAAKARELGMSETDIDALRREVDSALEQISREADGDLDF